MKVLVVSNMYPSHQNPGYGVFVKNFSDALEQHGVSVSQVVIVGRSKSKLRKIVDYIFFSSSIWFKILQGRYDLIYVHYVAHSLLPIVPLAGLLTKRGVRLVCNAHGEDLLPRTRFERAIFRFVYRTIECSDLLVVPSPYFKDLAKSKFSEVDIFVSPSGGVDLEIFKPIDKASSNTLTLNLGYVSRIDPGKGWDILLRAAKIIHESSYNLRLKVSFVGDGSERQQFLERINELALGDCVSYLGAMPQASLPKFYATIDAFVFPTQLPESLGLVGIEAMACGVPVIGSNIGGVSGYLDSGSNGFLFSPGDVDGLVSSILTFSELNNQDRDRLREHSLATAGRYNKKVVSDHLYTRLVRLVRGAS